jgi:hypothetical protein
MRRVPREAVPDMPDRIVAATAVYFGVPVISRDGRIRASSVQTLWQKDMPLVLFAALVYPRWPGVGMFRDELPSLIGADFSGA